MTDRYNAAPPKSEGISHWEGCQEQKWSAEGSGGVTVPRSAQERTGHGS